MVLQMAPAKAHIWGYADSSGSVTVLLDGQQVAQGTVDGSRKWSASLPATDEGGPHTIEVQVGGSSAKISDVHFGDVWYCAGQSNMVVEMYRVRIVLLTRPFKILHQCHVNSCNIRQHIEIITAYLIYSLKKVF